MSEYLLAEFETKHAIAEAARHAADAGHAPQDALTPSPVEGLADLLSPPHRYRRIGWAMFYCGVAGAICGYFMQWYSATIDYPIISGNRPFDSWPAFLIVPYEMAILFASVIGLLIWMWMCGLPKLFHPLFAAPVVERASQDRYLLVFSRDEKSAAWVRDNLRATAIHEIRE